MKIIAFAGSNSKNSINKQLASYASSLFQSKETQILDLNDYEMPIYGIDLEEEKGIPEAAVGFAAALDDADLLIISLAEHNGAYATVFKNIFDWISRIPNRKAFGDKPLLLMATSPGARGGSSVLEVANGRLPYSGANVLASFSVPNFYDNFKDGKLTDDLNTDLLTIIQKIEAEL